jgi:hypothetical protein
VFKRGDCLFKLYLHIQRPREDRAPPRHSPLSSSRPRQIE